MTEFFCAARKMYLSRFEGLIDGAQRRFAPDEDGEDHVGKDHDVAQRQHRQACREAIRAGRRIV